MIKTGSIQHHTQPTLLPINPISYLMKLYIGTAGWSYDEWVGPFYPDKSTPKLKHYCSIFCTVEIDSTFYSYPSPNLIQGWIKNTPPGFKFSAKLPKIITHEKKLQNAELDTKKFLDLLKPLYEADKLGVILIQLPPGFSSKYSIILQEFVKNLPPELKYAVEFRNQSWYDVEFLQRYNICSVITDSPLGLQTKITANFAYIRYHGRGKKIWYDFKYTEEQIKNFAIQIDRLTRQCGTIFSYFNNHYGAYAAENALQLIEITGNLSPKQRQQLIRMCRRGLDSFF